jgi:predicted small integral membrane protein
MVLRIAKQLLLAGVALFHLLVVFNNLTDFDSNFQFVRHVLMMDTTLPGNHGMWRALLSPALQLAFYLAIIAWELVITIFLGWGGLRLLRALRLSAAEFNAAKSVALGALVLSLMLWLVAFLTVGGEWFLMWQSHIWNGQDAAFRNFAVVGLVLLILMQPDLDIPSSHPLI